MVFIVWVLGAGSIESGSGLELLFHSGMKHKYFPLSKVQVRSLTEKLCRYIAFIDPESEHDKLS